jgi:iron(III) transport system substrate-binding protein
VLLTMMFVVLAACGGAGDPATSASGTLQLYTSVTQETVDAVVAGFQDAHPGVTVEVFRAPTGELTARLAAEQREGGIRADVLWLTDPLSIQQYAADGVLADLAPDGIEAVPEQFRAARFFGTRVLNLVLVHQRGTDPAPSSWADLARDFAEPVALPDPAFAGSAFGALGYFATADGYGFEFYEDLAAAGAVQVQAPGDVVTGVAEGQYAAGLTLDMTARTAIDKGSPIEMVFPEPGAIAIYSPIGVVADSGVRDLAETFAAYTITRGAQRAIASTGWQPVRDDVEWSHPTEPSVSVDWDLVFDRQEELLNRYRDIIGG